MGCIVTKNKMKTIKNYLIKKDMTMLDNIASIICSYRTAKITITTTKKGNASDVDLLNEMNNEQFEKLYHYCAENNLMNG